MMKSAAAALVLLGAQFVPAMATAPPPAPFSTDAERCIVPAAMHHGVNYDVLRAILKVESGLKAKVVNRNPNGTVDVGIGQTNSIHFRELAQFGIAPNDLLDACISTYVAAWQLKKTIAKYGNTWEGVARYHSGTPYFNRRYQILLKNELVRGGVMAGTVQSVAPVNVFSHLNVAAGRSSDTTTGTRSNSSLLVSDQP